MGIFLLVIGLEGVVGSSRGGVTGEGETGVSFLEGGGVEVDGAVCVAVCMGNG